MRNSRLYLPLILILFASCLSSKAQIDTALFRAIQQCDLPALQRIEKRGVDINAVDHNGANALMWAVYYCELPMVKELVHHGAKVGDSAVVYFESSHEIHLSNGYYGSLPSIAAGKNKLAILKYLADSLRLPLDEMEFDPFVRKKGGWTPLLSAVYYGHADAVNYLLQKGVLDNPAHPLQNFSALLLAIRPVVLKPGNWNIYKLLLKAGLAKQLDKQADYFMAVPGKFEKEFSDRTRDDKKLLHQFEKQDSTMPAGIAGLRKQYIIELTKAYVGQEHPLYASILMEQAISYRVAGQYEKALPLYEQALAIQQKASGEEPVVYAAGLCDLANLYRNTKQYEKSLPLLLQALTIQKSVFGEESIFYAACLRNLATTYSYLKQYDQAIALVQQALGIIRKVMGEGHIMYSLCAKGLIKLYQDSGQSEKALLLLQQMATIRRNDRDQQHPAYTAGLPSLEDLFRLMGHDRKGFPIVRAPPRSWNGEAEYAASLLELVSFYIGRGQYKEALPLFQEAIAVHKKIYGPNHAGYAMPLSSLGTLYMKLGEYEKALPLAQQALAIIRKLPEVEALTYANILNDLAELYVRIAQYEKAIPLLQEALAIRKKELGEVNSAYAINVTSLARLYQLTKQYDKALPLFQQAFDIYKRVAQNTHRYAVGLNNLAQLYNEMGQYEKALPLIQEAADITKKMFGEDHPDYATNIEILASVFTHLAKYNDALTLFKQSLSIRKKILGEQHPDYPESLGNIGRIYDLQGLESAAAACFAEADSLTLTILTHIYTSLSEKEKMEFLNQHAYQFAFLPSLLSFQQGVPRAVCNRVYTNELALKSMVLHDQQTVMNSIHHSGDTSVTKLYQGWTENMRLLGKQLLLPVNKRMPGINNLQETTNQLEQELSRRAVSFRNAITSQFLVARSISQKLLQKQAAVEFIRFRLYHKRWTDSILYAALLLLPGDTVCKFIPLCEEQQLKLLVGRPSAIKTASLLNDSLYMLVWKPLEPFLAGINTVYYAPTGLLHRIAFQSLHADSAHLLIDKYQLNQLLSTRSLALPDSVSPRPATAALWGNIDYGTQSGGAIAARGTPEGEEQTDTLSSFALYNADTRASRNTGWPPLSGTQQEIDSIVRMLRQAGVRVSANSGAIATEEAFKALDGKSPQLLHLATHGFFLPVRESKPNNTDPVSGRESFSVQQNPLFRSGLVLAGGNHTWKGEPTASGKEDGILTAYEIAQMDLSRTDLVVLSACETALGDLQGNEGVFGLQRAFKLAGVKQLIVSLWKVPDAETTELMTLFYRNWLGGQTTREALRNAQLKMKAKYPPEKWAAFVLVE